MCNEIASTTKRTTGLLGLSLLHSPPFRDPIFPTNGNQITHDPEQYSKPESIRVMYVMPTLPSLMAPRTSSLGAERLRTIPREAAAGRRDYGGETTRVIMGKGDGKKNILYDYAAGK